MTWLQKWKTKILQALKGTFQSLRRLAQDAQERKKLLQRCQKWFQNASNAAEKKIKHVAQTYRNKLKRSYRPGYEFVSETDKDRLQQIEQCDGQLEKTVSRQWGYRLNREQRILLRSVEEKLSQQEIHNLTDILLVSPEQYPDSVSKESLQGLAHSEHSREPSLGQKAEAVLRQIQKVLRNRNYPRESDALEKIVTIQKILAGFSPEIEPVPPEIEKTEEGKVVKLVP